MVKILTPNDVRRKLGFKEVDTMKYSGDREFKMQYLGVPYEESPEEREKRMKKAIEHERSFGQKQDTDIIKKRMDSDMFKGGF